MNFLRQWAFFCLFAPLQIFAAAPITHLYFAEQFCHYFPKYDEKQKEQFFLGTVFPDIYYLGGIERTVTHFKDISLDDVLKEESPFLAGMKFHSHVDNKRDELLSHNVMVAWFPDLSVWNAHTFLKLLEDEITYPLIDRSFCIDCCSDILSEELTWGLTRGKVWVWHLFLWRYLHTSPRETVEFLSDRGWGLLTIPPSLVEKWSATFQEQQNREEIKHHIEVFLNLIVNEMKSAKTLA